MLHVLINAQPMTVVNTGIGRCLRGLVRGVEGAFGDAVRLSFFNGTEVVPAPPAQRGPGWREAVARLLWRMPTPLALGCRLASRKREERAFVRATSGFDVYHEAGYFPHPFEHGRTVLTVHDLSLIRFPHYHPPERVAFFNRHFTDRLAGVDRFCAVSEFTKGEMVEHLGIKPDSITVTPLGCDEAVFNTDRDAGAQRFLERAGVPEEFVLFVGTGDPRKRLDLAVAALDAARCSLPLVTVGWSGWGRGRGTFDLGYVTDPVLAELYRRAKLLLIPSEYEGFGLPVLEAMACGCPVVTSPAGALVEVGGDGVAVVEDVTDAVSFVVSFGGLVRDLLNDAGERVRLRRRGLERAGDFTWERTAARTVEAWAENGQLKAY